MESNPIQDFFRDTHCQSGGFCLKTRPPTPRAVSFSSSLLSRYSCRLVSHSRYEIREWRYDVFINPIIKRIAKKKLSDIEGCLSVPGKFGIVRRADKITVEAYNEQGKKFIKSAVRFVARVMQHELDHLDGGLFIDHVEEYVDVKKKE